jgi:hypothetical protein
MYTPSLQQQQQQQQLSVLRRNVDIGAVIARFLLKHLLSLGARANTRIRGVLLCTQRHSVVRGRAGAGGDTDRYVVDGN